MRVKNESAAVLYRLETAPGKHSPKEAIEARRLRAGDLVHCQAVANPSRGGQIGVVGRLKKGHRPERKVATRRKYVSW
jgi:hypothetical protein